MWGVPLAPDLPRRIAAMPEALRGLDADVICLQEVWTSDVRGVLVDGLAPAYAATPGARGGLLVLSRFPIEAERFTRFPYVRGSSLVETLAGKGRLDVVVRTPLGRVRVVDSHLAAGDVMARNAELRVLLDHLPRDLPLVVGADTNFWSVWQGELTSEYESVIAAGLEDANPPRVLPNGRLDPGAPTRPGWPRPEGDPWGRSYPDHVFYAPGGGIDVRVVAYRQAFDAPEDALSDHDAQVVELRLVRTKD